MLSQMCRHKVVRVLHDPVHFFIRIMNKKKGFSGSCLKNLCHFSVFRNVSGKSGIDIQSGFCSQKPIPMALLVLLMDTTLLGSSLSMARMQSTFSGMTSDSWWIAWNM